MFIVRDILNDNKMNEDFHYNLTPGEVAKFKNIKIMSSDINVASVNTKTY